jgi:hypothetical protein
VGCAGIEDSHEHSGVVLLASNAGSDRELSSRFDKAPSSLPDRVRVSFQRTAGCGAFREDGERDVANQADADEAVNIRSLNRLLVPHLGDTILAQPQSNGRGASLRGRRSMGGTQLEKALDLIDANLLMNRNEVLRYIQNNLPAVGEALRTKGLVEIPTSAGIVVIHRDQLAVVAA